MSVEQVTFDIPSDPGTLIAIKDGLAEIAKSKARAAGEKTLQNESFSALAEKTGVPNGVLRKLSNLQDEGIDKMRREIDDLEQLRNRLEQVKATPVPAGV